MFEGMQPDYTNERNLRNRYLQDREEMRTRSFLGMGPSFPVHDMWATEGEGAIQDRTTEHLGYTDKAVALSRRLLLKAAAAGAGRGGCAARGAGGVGERVQPPRRVAGGHPEVGGVVVGVEAECGGAGGAERHERAQRGVGFLGEVGWGRALGGGGDFLCHLTQLFHYRIKHCVVLDACRQREIVALIAT